MSVTIDMSERQFKFAMLKLSLSLALLLVLVALVLSLLTGTGQQLAVGALFACLGFGFLTNGLLAVLKIIDWFEARKVKNG